MNIYSLIAFDDELQKIAALDADRFGARAYDLVNSGKLSPEQATAWSEKLVNKARSMSPDHPAFMNMMAGSGHVNQAMRDMAEKAQGGAASTVAQNVASNAAQGAAQNVASNAAQSAASAPATTRAGVHPLAVGGLVAGTALASHLYNRHRAKKMQQMQAAPQMG